MVEGLITTPHNAERVREDIPAAPEAMVCDYVPAHAGFAIAIIDANEARETFRYP